MTCDLWVADFRLWSFNQMEVPEGETQKPDLFVAPATPSQPRNKDTEGAFIVVRFLENILPRFIIKI